MCIRDRSYTVEKKSSTDRFYLVGDEIDYSVVVTNTGQVPIENLVIEDTLVDAADMTLVESENSDGILEVGETWTYTYVYKVTSEDIAAGTVLNRVVVSDPLNPEEPVEDDVTVPKPSYTVEKTASTDRFHQVGDQIDYSVVVTNTGQVAIENLAIEDTLVDAADMTLVESKNPDGILEVGETWTYTYVYVVTSEDIATGTVLNQVVVSDPLNPDEPVEDEVTVPKPSYTVEKTSAMDRFLVAGDEIDYTIVVKNTGL